MKGIRPDAPDEAIAAVVRALAPVLAYPITKVRKVVRRRIVFDDWAAPATPAIALAAAPARVLISEIQSEFQPVFARGSVTSSDSQEAEKFVLSALLALLLLRAWVSLRARPEAWAGRGPPVLHITHQT